MIVQCLKCRNYFVVEVKLETSTTVECDRCHARYVITASMKAQA
jgi:hypothetical protein